MQKISNKKGLSAGVIFALLTGLFAGLPASAATNNNGDYIALTPAAGPIGNFVGVLDEDFPVTAYLLPGVSNANFAANSTKVLWEVTKTAGALEVLVSTASSIADGVGPTSVSPAIEGYIQASSSAAVTFSASVSGAAKSTLTLRAYTTSAGIVSSSPSVTLTLKVWVENDATTNGKWDELEWYTTKTVTLKSLNAVTAATSLTQPVVGDTVITASATVGDLNFQNIDGYFFLALASNKNSFVDGSSPADTTSAGIRQLTLANRAGVVSSSFAVSGSGVLEGATFSAQVRYSKTDPSAVTDGTQLGSIAYYTATAPKSTTLTLDVVDGNDATQSAQVARVRANKVYTFEVSALSSSTTVSAALKAAFTSAVSLGVNTKEIKVNGAAATTSWPTELAVSALSTGVVTFTVETIGFVDGDDFTIKLTDGAISKSLEVQVEGTVPTLKADYSNLLTAPGTAVDVTYNVKDQWGVAYAGNDLRVKLDKGGTGFAYTTTTSYVAVASGKATFAFTPEAATKTGSATVTARLQQLQTATGTYVDASGATNVVVTVNVSSTADSFGTGLAASYSATISYFPSTLSWTTVTAKVANTGSAVLVSGKGLIFRDVNGNTKSDEISIRTGAGVTYTVEVTSLLEGNYTMTLKNGAATTTSLIVVGAAAHDSGASIAFDTSTITAGSTKIITGRVLDANGNGVDTTAGAGTASILVTYAGTAGIPVGSMPTETNAKGEFQISVLTSEKDSGTFTLTATYLKAGSSTATADKITKVQTITVAAAAAPVVADQKLTVGSFKGYVAIYAKGYAGKKLSAKVAGKWISVASLSDFQRVVRNTGAGYTIKVDLYIDGSLVKSETVTTK